MEKANDNRHLGAYHGNGAAGYTPIVNGSGKVADGNGIARTSVKITPKPTQKKVRARA